MVTIKTQLPAERAHKYIEQLQSATPGTLELAAVSSDWRSLRKNFKTALCQHLSI